MFYKSTKYVYTLNSFIFPIVSGNMNDLFTNCPKKYFCLILLVVTNFLNLQNLKTKLANRKTSSTVKITIADETAKPLSIHIASHELHR